MVKKALSIIHRKWVVSFLLLYSLVPEREKKKKKKLKGRKISKTKLIKAEKSSNHFKITPEKEMCSFLILLYKFDTHTYFGHPVFCVS